MPVYNGLPLIKASIASLQKQKYDNWECIIVDDGSTDGTSQYLDSIKDIRFVIHHLEKNSGRPVARQKALEMAKGKYIAMLDAEDLYNPKKIKRQVDILDNHPEYALVTTAMCSFGSKTENLYVRGASSDEIVDFDGNSTPAHAPSLMRSEIAKKCKYNHSLKLGEDVDFLEKYLCISGKYYRMHEVLYYYSELNSVSKDKIRKNYWLYIWKYREQKNYKKMFVYASKYFYSIIVFPFVSIDSILVKRGRNATDEEHMQFNLYCRPLIKNN